MRIAITSSGLGSTARGIEAWAKSLAEGLHREGENVILFHGGGSYTCPNVKLNYLHRDTLPIRLLTRLAPKFTWRWGLTSRYGLEQRLFTRALLRWLRQHPEERPDIIHTQDYVVSKRLQHAVQACPGVVPPYSAGRSRIIFGNASDEPPATLTGLPYLHHISQPDYAAAIAFVALFLGETIADEQQWKFQTAKYAAIARGETPEVGFITTGLFRYSRHPNFFCEQAMWWTYYVFSIAAGAGWLNWTISGAVLLTLLFQASTGLTEKLSARKYPAYTDYQRTTNRLMPWFPA